MNERITQLPKIQRLFPKPQVNHRRFNLTRAMRKCSTGIRWMIVVAMVFGTIAPLNSAQAAEQSRWLLSEGQCAAPERTTNDEAPGPLFLPFVASAAQSLFAAIAGSNTGQNTEPFAETIATANQMQRTLEYQSGKVYTYLYDYALSTQNSSRDKTATRTEQPFVSRINAYADITVMSVDAAGAIDAHLVLRDPFICSVSDQDQQTVVDNQEYLDQLATPLRFKQSSDGTIVDVTSDPSLPSAVTNLQKGVLNFVQVKLQADSNTYSAMEVGGQGTYNANYTLEDKDDGLHITKTIQTGDYQALKSKGDESQSLQLSTTLNMIVGQEEKVLTSVVVAEDHMSADGTEDPANTDPTQGADGLSIWSTVKTNGSLILQSVTDVPATVNAAALFATYMQDEIGGELDGEYSASGRIDLSLVDVDAELAALEADAANSTLFMRILELQAADALAEDPDKIGLVDKIGTRLQMVQDNETLSMLYVDFLGTIGTPEAQNYLNGLFGQSTVQAANISATTTITTQQQALMNMMTLSNPVTETVQTVRMVSADDDSPLQPGAATALGGMADEIEEYDPDLELEILEEIEESLLTAETVDDAILYLDVLGNIGDEISVEVINYFLTDPILINDEVVTDTIDIEDLTVVAYEALRRIPGEEAESVLVQALWNEELEPWVRDIVAGLLIDRDFDDETILSQETAELLDEYLDLYLDAWDDDYDEEEANNPDDEEPGDGFTVRASSIDGTDAVYSRTWGKNFGNKYMGVRLPGSIYASTPPNTTAAQGGGLYVRATQRIDAYIWKVLPDYNVASGSAETRYIPGGNLQQVDVDLTILNNKFRPLDSTFVVACTQELGPFQILNRYISVLNATVTIFVLGVIPITFGATVGGTISLTVDVGTNNVCFGDARSVRLRVTPGLSLTATGEAYLNLLFAQGGVALTGHLIKTTLPTQGRVEYTASTGVQRWCVNVDVAVQPFAVRFYLFARARFNIFVNKWPINKSWTVASYSSPNYTYPIFGFCQ